MSHSFRFVALPHEQFIPLFEKDDLALQAIGARRMVVDEKPGFPCRVSLVDGAVGEVVLSLSYMHHDVLSPYRASGPIFVRHGATTVHPEPNEIPIMFRQRLLSLRAYDSEALMIDAETIRGDDLDAGIRRLLNNPRVVYLHVHNAGPGCYNCKVERA